MICHLFSPKACNAGLTVFITTWAFYPLHSLDHFLCNIMAQQRSHSCTSGGVSAVYTHNLLVCLSSEG